MRLTILKRVLYTVMGCSVLLLVLAVPAKASGTGACPVLSGSGGGENVDSTYTSNSGNTNGGCNVLITFGSGGSISTINPNGQNYYDTGGDDNMVGIINNSGSTINSIHLTSAMSIFGFETYPNSDGPCSGFTLSSGFSCSGGDSTLYGGPGVTFSNINGSGTSGTVNFAGGIANGGTAWFGLEGPASLTAQGVTPGGQTTEPASLVLLGTGLIGFAFRRFRA